MVRVCGVLVLERVYCRGSGVLLERVVDFVGSTYRWVVGYGASLYCYLWVLELRDIRNRMIFGGGRFQILSFGIRLLSLAVRVWRHDILLVIIIRNFRLVGVLSRKLGFQFIFKFYISGHNLFELCFHLCMVLGLFSILFGLTVKLLDPEGLQRLSLVSVEVVRVSLEEGFVELRIFSC